MTAGKPDGVNSYSFTNMTYILSNVGEKADTKKYKPEGSTAWIYMENGGGIYAIPTKLIKMFLNKNCNLK